MHSHGPHMAGLLNLQGLFQGCQYLQCLKLGCSFLREDQMQPRGLRRRGEMALPLSLSDNLEVETGLKRTIHPNTYTQS